MSVDVAKDKPPDDKQAHLSQNENEASVNISEPISKSSVSANVIQIDDPSFINSNCPNSDKTCGEESIEKDENSISSDASKIATEISDEPDVIATAIEKRKQPLMELAYSEESYVRRLRVVYELYMPAPYRSPPPADAITPGMSAVSPALPVSTSGFEELASRLPPGGPVVPEDLVARWRILWGNWMQLFEWHTGFYEKLRALLDEDPDRIPKLFIDSRARLRSIYSKYCENQIKAAHIAEQHKEFFDEWRIFVGDKEDVISLLMQPVQRIMRYQLPISEIVKWTERAKIPSLHLWQKSLDIMKEIPKDTQLILEAARIDGFPGVITALGTLRIRGDLLVASLSRSELADALRSYAKSLNILPSNPTSRNSSGLSLLTKRHFQSSTASDGGVVDKEEISPTAVINVPATPEATSTSAISTANAPCLEPNSPASSLPQSTTPGVPLPPPLPLQPQLSRGSSEAGEGFAPPPPPVLPGGQKFVVSRLFLFDRMLLVTEEVKAKRKGTSADAFAQSTYQFRAAVNVNKMKFEPHWFMCSLTSEPAQIAPTALGTSEGPTSASGTPTAFAAVVASEGPANGATVSSGDQYAGSDWSSVRAALDFAASDDLRFALWDQTPGRDVVYIIDPQTVATRSAWVVHLRDIQRMQQQLLMALEDPTRFAAAEKEWGSPPASSAELPTLRSQLSREQVDPQKTPSISTGTRKWPSFTVRRPGRLSSASSATTFGAASTQASTQGARGVATKSKVTTTPCSTTQDGVGGSSLLRSFSAERHRVSVTATSTTPTCTVDPATPMNTGSPQKPFVIRSSSSPHRKLSSRVDGGGFGQPDRVDSVESTSSDSHRNSMGRQKTKKAFSYFFFGKLSKKGRNSGGSSHTPHPLPPSQISLPPASVQQTSLSPKPRIDSLPPPHPSPMADVSSECSS